MKSLHKKIHKMYWDLEYWLEEKKYVLGIPPFLAFVFMFFIQTDYVLNKHKRDLTALPKDMQERHKYVCGEQLKLSAQEDHLKKRFFREEAAAVEKIRVPLHKECLALENQAPHTSYAYNFYATLGLINTKKDTQW